jgi:hypothetical protein
MRRMTREQITLDELFQALDDARARQERTRYVSAILRAIEEVQATYDGMHPTVVTLRTVFERQQFDRFDDLVRQFGVPEITSLEPLVNDPALRQQSESIRPTLDGLRREMLSVSRVVLSPDRTPKLRLYLYDEYYREGLLRQLADTLCKEAVGVTPSFTSPSLCSKPR